MALSAAVLRGCSYASPPQAAFVYPQTLPDRDKLVSLMDAFLASHRSCSVQKDPDCLGPTTIWAATADPAQPNEVWVSIRQLAAPHNEYAVRAHHNSTGWVIISIALIDA